jgi:Fe-Mn family superoxide dismutase
MAHLTRRSLAAGASLLAGAGLLPARAQQIATVPVSTKFVAKALTFDPEKVKGLSAGLLRAHHNRYGEAVKRLNAIREEIAKLDLGTPDDARLGELKREELRLYNATALLELYFDGIGETRMPPSGLLAQAMERDFAGMDRWKAEFAASAASLAGGAGWVIMAYSGRDKRLAIFVAENESIAPVGTSPLLALDMSERAYAADYGANAAKYVEAFMGAIRWTNAERLYREAMRV